MAPRGGGRTSRPSVLVALLAACGGDRPVHSPAADLAGERSGSAAFLFDGFEGDDVAGFWLPGDHGSGRYAPGAVSIAADRARSGNRSVRITVREGDVEQTGGSGQLNERAELDSGNRPFAGRDLWYGFSFLIPEGFPVVDTRLVLAQWKQSGLEGSPLVAVRFRAGRHSLTVRDPASTMGAGKEYGLPDLPIGQWNDMVFRIRFSAEDDGSVEAWMNGAQVVSHRGRTASRDGEDRIYNKIGLYRDRWKDPMTIYFDNYAVGDRFAAVDPARLDRSR
ncbi:MAG: polysaccharide lyase [Planctomycetes bacterium]|nr:polysaccharide lyase [Planctomycetota bacterium]